MLMDALRLAPEVHAVVAGEDVAKEAAPQPNVEVISRSLTDEEFRTLIARCAAVILPYERANQSGVLATAFRAARPVIATAVGAFAEYVDDGRNGILVEPGDPTALAAAMRELRGDTELARSLAEQARRTWDEHMAPQAAARRIVDALRR